MDDLFISTLVYILFCALVAFPPSEVLSAGLTLDKIFSFLLDDEHLRFVQFNIKRMCLTIFIHSCLPLGYFLLLKHHFPGFSVFDWPLSWQLAGAVALLLPICIGLMIVFWSLNDWKRHPVVRSLALYDAEDWRSVAAAINTEFRRVDKFSVTLGGVRRVVVTDSWVLLVTSYNLHLSQQSDVRLSVVRSDHHPISHHSDSQVQFLDIRVENIAKPIAPFVLRLNSINYSDLRNKLQQPLTNARDVMIQQSLDERFVHAFLDQVHENPKHPMSRRQIQETDMCLACSQIRADVKLVKRCLDGAEMDEDGEPVPVCAQCYCRPMWCVSCMGRWFASRQDTRRPERWMSGRSPCPTCRAVFCVLDVCAVIPAEA